MLSGSVDPASPSSCSKQSFQIQRHRADRGSLSLGRRVSRGRGEVIRGLGSAHASCVVLHPVWACELSSSLSLTPCNPTDCSQWAPLSMKFFQARILEWVAFPSPGDLSDSGMDPVFLASPVLQVDSLPPSHLGRPVHHGCVLKHS